MANLSTVVKALRKERQRATKQIERIDAALAALGNLSSRSRDRRKGHTMSASARRKIAAAQRARWAKVKAKKAS
jgi:nucleoid DNA-binding protein